MCFFKATFIAQDLRWAKSYLGYASLISLLLFH
jgi:hypothetical protein